MPGSPFEPFHPAVAAWFRETLGEPTRAQVLGWPPIARGESALLFAPTGSGKTLAAFLVALDRRLRAPAVQRAGAAGTRVVYVSPLKALASDVERNLRVPLAGITEIARRSGQALSLPTIDVRTGDTPARERARMKRAPAEILITTPESLYLVLTSAARESLATVETIIVDEVHALVATKRGAHLALSLERLEALRLPGSSKLQRIGLSATQRPLDEVARWLGGFEGGAPRPVSIVDAGAAKVLDLRVHSPAPPAAHGPQAQDRRRIGSEIETQSRSTWPALHAELVELVRAHRTTLVFVNSRRLAERLASAMNDLAGEEIALAHHGSLAREKRAAIEERLKSGGLPALVATSSLELGIDVGAVDLVVQVESPPTVASGLQRVGRACHGVGGVPRGVLLPKHKHDLVACAAATAAMRSGEVEETFYPRNPLDVLAQQIVAMVAMGPLSVIELFDTATRAAPFAELPRAAFDGVLDMLSGRALSDDFFDLRPRVTWDRARDVVEGRVGAHRLAVTNAGTIPDRGLYGVFTAGEGGLDASGGRRVGELDEEMVFEMREGDVFFLGSSSWRVLRITHERVVVAPASGEPGLMPFWHGDRPARSRGFGMRVGEVLRRAATGQANTASLRESSSLSAEAAEALTTYVRAQVEATGEVPSDQSIVIERFVDELGDVRVVVLSPVGLRVIAPWAIAVAARLREVHADVDVHTTDDGMAFRIGGCAAPPPAELFLPGPTEVEAMVTRALGGTALFAARFRECAARALLLPRRDPRKRSPLWAQRKRAASLLAAASRQPAFPILLETYRECLRDTFDLPGLVQLLGDVAARAVRVSVVDSRVPSPFSSNVLFAFAATFIYEGDAPRAERHAQALAIDGDRLAELLGDVELRALLDPDVTGEHERALQRLSRPASHADGVHDMLLAIGDLSLSEIAARCDPPGDAGAWIERLVSAGRAFSVPVAGAVRYAAIEDAGKLRDALGVGLPASVPLAYAEPAPHALRDVVARFARTHAPFSARDAAHRLGLEVEAVEQAAGALLAEGRLVRGAFLPGGTELEWCDREVLGALRRKSLAKLRQAVEPVDVAALARFLPAWQGLGRKRRGRDGLRAVVAELEGCPLVFSALESEVLPARVADYRPWDLDALCASGEVVWSGVESLGGADGRIALYRAEHEPLLRRSVGAVEGAVADGVRTVLGRRGAVFFTDLIREVGGFPGAILDALWQMIWTGEVTNDTLEPLRARARSAADDGRGRGHARRAVAAANAGLPGGEGRWSLRAARDARAQAGADRALTLARSLLGRYGVLTREAAQAESIEGGFAAVYDVLKALEEQGRVRRGFFIQGRGGAQFALPGADERLRALRETGGDELPMVLAATDPASAWGAVVDWPASAWAARSVPGPLATIGAVETRARPQRSAGALVIQDDGRLLGWLGRGDHPLLTFLPERDPARGHAAARLAAALAQRADGARTRALLIGTIDGVPAGQSDLAVHFVRAGFTPTLRGLHKRATPKRDHPEGGGPVVLSDA